MAADDPRVRAFFEQYARGRTTRDVELIASQYADPFMVGDPNGPRVATKAVVLALFPTWLERLKAQGHTSTELRSLESTDLGGYYRLARAQLVWCFDRPAARVELPVDSTFILCVKDQTLSIAVQLEREDFRDVLRSHGIVMEQT
jgi:ketosteroid isomerase-like protein